ncbi:MAG: hypothetical protein ACXVI9_08690 [Mucilaginibacter sp.]
MWLMLPLNKGGCSMFMNRYIVWAASEVREKAHSLRAFATRSFCVAEQSKKELRQLAQSLPRFAYKQHSGDKVEVHPKKLLDFD